MIDRDRLQTLHQAEEQRFVTDHPRSADLAEEAGGHLLAGVPMPWMTRWPGAFPIFFDTASGARFTDVDGREYVDLCLGDTGAMTGHALPEVAEAIYDRARTGITTMLPSTDAAWVAGELSRRFGLPRWQMAMSATDANRFVLRFARHLTGRPKIAVMDWCYHGTVDETLAVLDGGSGRAASGRPRTAGGRGPDDPRGALQRPRGARGGPRPRGRGRGPHGARADQHRHRASGRGLPRRGSRADPGRGHAAGDRRDAHPVRRTGRVHPRLGARPGHRRGRQADRWRRPRSGVRRQRRGRRPARAPDAVARHRRRGCRAARSPATRWRWPPYAAP